MKKYLIENTELMNEWDKDNNDKFGYDPCTLTYGSKYKVFWICSKCGFKWSAIIKDRTNGHGCPQCGKKKSIETRRRIIVEKEGSLFEKCSELMKEWDYEKNKKYDPKKLTIYSNVKVWWKCKKCGNEWQTKIANRTALKNNCPKCAIKNLRKTIITKKIEKKGRIFDKYPELLKEWNYDKNQNIKPEQIVGKTNKKVWWKCSICGNEWEASINHRCGGSGCPKCYRRNQTSFPEQVLFYYIKKKFPKTINKYTDIFDNGMELDIFIPELNIGIEYDGYMWHNNSTSQKREKVKYEYCKKNNISLIRIKEIRNNEKPNNNKNCNWMIVTDYNDKNDYDSLNLMLQEVFNILKIDLITNVEKDSRKIKACYYSLIKEKNLYNEFPLLCEEWNYEKNNGLKPDMFKAYSNEKVWWRCRECGFEWEANIANRTSGTICPMCAKEKKSNSLRTNWQKRIDKVIQKNGSLKDNYPELLKEWDYKKNTIKPENITEKSHTSAYWICSKCGYNWTTEIRARAIRKNGCPKCRNKII